MKKVIGFILGMSFLIFISVINVKISQSVNYDTICLEIIEAEAQGDECITWDELDPIIGYFGLYEDCWQLVDYMYGGYWIQEMVPGCREADDTCTIL